MSKKNFRDSILNKAKTIRVLEEIQKEEDSLTEGEKYILERKRERGESELTLGERLLQERFSSIPDVAPQVIEESVETQEVQEEVQETAQMISEVAEVMTEETKNLRVKDPKTEEGRLLEYMQAIRINEEANKKSLVEQDLQNTPATMAELANLRSVVTRLQTSLTSLGGGGIGYDEVRRMIQDGDYNIDSADLWALEAALEKYVDSAIATRLDSADLIGEYTTDDIVEGGNLYYTQARWDSAFSAKSTSDLPEGSNLYYTSARFDADFATKTLHDSAAIQAQIDSAIGAADLDLSSKTTTDLAEGSNLYYTKARFDSAFSAKSTTDLNEGANLYYTKARHDSDFDTRLATKNTDDLAEGSNLYYTQERWDSAFAGKTSADLDEGSNNLYYTKARHDSDFDTRFAVKNTDDLAEGSSNYYYTSGRFDADFSEKSTDSLSEGSTNLYYTDARVTALVDSAYVQERVTLEAGVHFKGVVSFADSDAPANPAAGDMYISDSDTITNATWVGIAGDLIEAQHGVVWAEADSSWHELGNTSVDTSVYVEKDGDNMTGTLDIDEGNINIKKGYLDVWEGDILLSDAAAGVYTDNIFSRTNATADYVTIFQGADAKLAMKNLENVSYQAMTYPNNTASTVASSGTASTLIHKGYVDSAMGEVVSKSGDEMTGTLTLNDTLIFGGDHNRLMRINPAGGTTQTVDMFTHNSGGQILKVSLQGATYQNAIEFESGPSNNKDTLLRIDANKGIKVHGLSADSTRIQDVADPTQDKDAANKQYVHNNFVLKNGTTTVGTSGITLDASGGGRFTYKGPASGLGFQIARDTGVIMFYQQDNDIRLTNYAFNDNKSILNREKGDGRYVQQTNGVVSGDLEFRGDVTIANGELDGNNRMHRVIDITKDGNNYTVLDIKNQGFTKVTLLETGGSLSGYWDVRDGQDPDGNTITGGLNMGRNKIEDVGEPTELYDAANKKYVDEKGVEVRSGEPLSTSVGSMWYDTNTGALVIRVS